jgi:hypothetical protein
MQRLGLGGRLVGWRVQGVIKAAFNDAWQHEPANRKKYDQENQPAEAFHGHSIVYLLRGMTGPRINTILVLYSPGLLQ